MCLSPAHPEDESSVHPQPTPVHDGLVETGQSELQQDVQTAWHRFGAWASDIDPTTTFNCRDDPPEDEHYVFVGHRRPDSLLYVAPVDDSRLMGGWREPGDEGDANTEASCATSDAFELLLLGDLADI